MLQKEESLSEKIIKKGFWIYLFVILLGPVNYGIRIILNENLSVGDVGLFYGIMSLIVILSTYNDFGMTESLNFFMPKYLVKHDYARSKALYYLALFCQLATGFIIVALLYFLAPWLAEHYFHDGQVVETIRIMSLYFIGVNLLQIGTILFSVSQDTKLGRGIDFFRMFSTLCLVIVFAFLGFRDLETYAWGWVAGVYIGAVLAIILSYKKYFRVYFSSLSAFFDSQSIKSFLKYSLATLLTANIGMMMSQIDMQLIVYFLGKEPAGYYSAYLSLISVPFILFTPILAFLFPVISELSGRGNTGGIRDIWRSFSQYLSLIAVWVSAFFFFFGPAFSQVFFSAKYLESGEILQYSAPFIIFNFLLQINFQILAGTGMVRERAKILSIALGMNLFLNLFFIIGLGMGTRGSALAVGISWIPLWYMSHRAISAFTGYIGWKKLLKNTVISISTFVILSFFISFFHIDTRLSYLGARLENLIIILIALFGSFIIFSIINWDLYKEVKLLFLNVFRRKVKHDPAFQNESTVTPDVHNL